MMNSGVVRKRSSDRATTPSEEFSTGTTPKSAAPAAVARKTSSMLTQSTLTIDEPKYPRAACSLNVPAGPRKATRLGVSSARQADMISRQTGATLSVINGPVLIDLSLSMTWASRSGRKAMLPSNFFTSPTCSASAARRLTRASNSRSRLSIWTRKACRSGFTLGGRSAMALKK